MNKYDINENEQLEWSEKERDLLESQKIVSLKDYKTIAEMDNDERDHYAPVE